MKGNAAALKWVWDACVGDPNVEGPEAPRGKNVTYSGGVERANLGQRQAPTRMVGQTPRDTRITLPGGSLETTKPQTRLNPAEDGILRIDY